MSIEAPISFSQRVAVTRVAHAPVGTPDWAQLVGIVQHVKGDEMIGSDGSRAKMRGFEKAYYEYLEQLLSMSTEDFAVLVSRTELIDPTSLVTRAE